MASWILRIAPLNAFSPSMFTMKWSTSAIFGGSLLSDGRLTSAREIQKPLVPPPVEGDRFTAASARSPLPYFASHASKSFHWWPKVPVTYAPLAWPVSTCQVSHVQVSPCLRCQSMWRLRPSSYCCAIPGLGTVTNTRPMLPGFSCAIGASAQQHENNTDNDSKSSHANPPSRFECGTNQARICRSQGRQLAQGTGREMKTPDPDGPCPGPPDRRADRLVRLRRTLTQAAIRVKAPQAWCQSCSENLGHAAARDSRVTLCPRRSSRLT